MFMGKLLGGLFGFAWLGWLGGLLGLYIGHMFDKGLSQNFSGGFAGFSGLGGGASHEEIQHAFFRATFMMMGRLAKADGRVSQHEIKWAENVMARMSLTPELRREAIELFNRGKDDGADLTAELGQLRQVAGRQAMLMQMFLEIQIQAAYADADLSQVELEILRNACAQLGISALRFEMIHQRVRAERTFSDYQQQQAGGGGARYQSANQLADAYKVLGVEENASDAAVKKAYRRLMSQHHPDKLVAKGLPDEMMELAKEKTQEIQAAYETIKEARK